MAETKRNKPSSRHAHRGITLRAAEVPPPADAPAATATPAADAVVPAAVEPVAAPVTPPAQPVTRLAISASARVVDFNRAEKSAGIALVKAGPAQLFVEIDGEKLQGYFAPAAIEAAVRAGVFEGADSYLNHPTPAEERDLPERDAAKKIGRVRNVTWDATRQEAVGTWKCVDDLLWSRVVNAVDAGEPDFLDFSIYGPGDAERRVIDGKPYAYITSIHRATVDLVTDGAAGGRFLTRLAASLRSAADVATRVRTEAPMKWNIFKAAKAALAEAMVKAGSDEAAIALLDSLELPFAAGERDAFVADLKAARVPALVAAATPAPVAASPAAPPPPPAPTTVAAQGMKCEQCGTECAADCKFCPHCGAAMPGVAAAATPQAVQAAVAAQVAAALKPLLDAQRDAAIDKRLADMPTDGDREYLKPLLRAAKDEAAMDAEVVRFRASVLAPRADAGFGGFPTSATPGITAGVDELDKHMVAIDGLIRGKDQKTDKGEVVPRYPTLAAAIQNHPSNRNRPLRMTVLTVAHHIRGSYIGAQVDEALHPGTKGERGFIVRAGKLIPIRAAITTAQFGEVYADRQHKAFMQEYFSASEWEPLMEMASEAPYWDDFKTHRLIRFGEYGNLSAIAEGATYPTVTTPADVEETGTLASTKRGAIETYTLESMLDPDGQKLSRFPVLLGKALGRTVREDVLDTITTTNPTLNADSVVLYHAATHSNLGTTALSAAGFAATRQAMRKQTAAGSSKRLGASQNDPLYVMVPIDLWDRADGIVHPEQGFIQYTNDASDASTATLDRNKWKHLKMVELTQATNTTDYYMMADPNKMPTFAFARLTGVPQPELFWQADPESPTMYDSDTGKIKVRFWWDVVPLEWRSFYWQDVA